MDGDNKKPFIVARDALETLTHVEVDGAVYELGLHKDLRKHPHLASFMPESGRLAVSWVALGVDQSLAPHTHPTASMIILTKGTGRLTGDLQHALQEGDVVCIPPYASHGFVGTGAAGFWGLSIQFSERGLYEDENTPLVRFGDSGLKRGLLSRQEEWKTKFSRNPVFEFLERTGNRRPFLSELRNWSDHFQKLIMLRRVLETNEEFSDVSTEHLKEEFGHNDGFSNVPKVTPSLAAKAIFAWFTDQMERMDDEQRLVAMHLAIEGAATVFYPKTKHLFVETDEFGHFEDHDSHDHAHEGMGLELIEGGSQKRVQQLIRVLDEHWEMMDSLMIQLMHDAQRRSLLASSQG